MRASSIDGVSVLVVHGELDTFTAPRLAKAIDHGLAASTTALVVDLSKLEFLASAGMSVLLDGHRSAQGSGKRLIVVADGPATSRPMKLMGLDQELNLRASLEAALTGCSVVAGSRAPRDRGKSLLRRVARHGRRRPIRVFTTFTKDVLDFRTRQMLNGGSYHGRGAVLPSLACKLREP